MPGFYEGYRVDGINTEDELGNEQDSDVSAVYFFIVYILETSPRREWIGLGRLFYLCFLLINLKIKNFI